MHENIGKKVKNLPRDKECLNVLTSSCSVHSKFKPCPVGPKQDHIGG